MKRLLASVSFFGLLAAIFFLSAGTVEAESGWIGKVTIPTLNVRAVPDTTGAPVGVLRIGERVTVQATVQGEAVKGDATWYQIGPDQYVYGLYVAKVDDEASSVGNGSADIDNGGERWLDVDLTNKITRAMVGDVPVYTAEVTIGRPGANTPVGTFSIVRRVENETMDSATIGIPRSSPFGYYYTDVLYTQYFLWTGQALHYNYWVPDEAFGNWASSRGCVGLRLADAQFFWDFADVGTTVVIHY